MGSSLRIMPFFFWYQHTCPLFLLCNVATSWPASTSVLYCFDGWAGPARRCRIAVKSGKLLCWLRCCPFPLICFSCSLALPVDIYELGCHWRLSDKTLIIYWVSCACFDYAKPLLSSLNWRFYEVEFRSWMSNHITHEITDLIIYLCPNMS